MSILNRLFFASAICAGVMLAHPMPNDAMKQDFTKAPKGVVPELYNLASVAKKRQVLQIEFDSNKKIENQTKKFREYRTSVMFDIASLKLDYQEAVENNYGTSKKMEILSRIANKQEEIRKSKQDEKNLRYILEEEKLKQINNVLSGR